MLRYAITDRRRFAGDETGRAEALGAQAAALAACGDVDYLQLREKDLPPARLAELARRILEALRENSPASSLARGSVCGNTNEAEEKSPHRPKLLINSRADIALAVCADGVHLTSSPHELTPAQVRQLYSGAGLPPPTISLSCHTLADVIAARGSRAGFGSGDELCFAADPATAPDLILFGPVFEKRVGDQLIAEGAGVKLLRQACIVATPIPVLALGGVTEKNVGDCLDAGVAGIAAIRLFRSEPPH